MANDVRARASLKDDLSGPLTRIGDVWNRQTKNFAVGALAAKGAEMAFSMVGRAIGGVTDFAKESVKAASDLNESLGKSQVVFGENADEIERWAERGADAFGLSKQAALEAAGTYGNLFQAFGLGQEKATTMSKALVELAADLASFNNTSMEDAILALRSGLSGETEPLKRYGIAISDARMRTELMSQGVTNLAGTLTPLQKTTAAYALILKDSSLAQGDFARTADGLANSQRSTAAEVENLKAKVGQGLIPVEKAWLEVQLGIVDGASNWLDSLEKQTAAVEHFRAQGLNPTMDELRAYMDAQGEVTFEHERAVGSLGDVEDATKDLAAETSALTTMQRGASRTTGTLRGALADLGYEAGDTDDAIDDLASTISEELFGTAINKGNLAELRDTAKGLREQRDAAKEGSREYNILTGKIAENEQAQFDLQLQMAEKEGPAAVLAFLDKARDKYGTNNTRLQAMIDKLRTVWSLLNKFDDLGVIDFGRYDGKIIPGYHTGGRPTPGEPAIVGEKGPELFVPDTAGTIVPNSAMGGGSGGGAGGGSPVVIQLVVDGRTLASIVDRHLYYAGGRSHYLPS